MRQLNIIYSVKGVVPVFFTGEINIMDRRLIIDPVFY